MTHSSKIFQLLLLAVAFLLAACSPKRNSGKPVLTVSIEPVRALVAPLVEGQFEVVTLMPVGASPETYEPTPRQMAELSESKALFCVGTLGFEQSRLPRMQEAAGAPPLVKLSEQVRPLPDGEGHPAHEAEGHSHDPHAWMSPQNLCLMLDQACTTLSRLDPDHASLYAERTAKEKAKWQALDVRLRRELAPLRGRAFLIYHPALGYFAQDYGLGQLAVEHDGKEPSVAYMQRLEEQCRAEGVKVVFISEEHSGRAARRLAERLGAKVVKINPLSYELENQFLLISRALRNE